ncbi:MAG: glycosyltransferase family 4 protein, partial [Acidobacteriota bacterium]
DVVRADVAPYRAPVVVRVDAAAPDVDAPMPDAVDGSGDDARFALIVRARTSPDGAPMPDALWRNALLLCAATYDLDVVLGGWAPPADGAAGAVPDALYARQGDPDVAAPAAVLLRLDRAQPPSPDATPLAGRIVPQITAATGLDRDRRVDAGDEALPRSGPYALRPRVDGRPHPALLDVPLDDPAARLAHVPAPATARERDIPGDRGAAADASADGLLFLLPFLAVGGAERLLLDLLDGLTDRRCVVVTLDPHRARLGQTVDRCRRRTPWIYTLGDWLPRAAHGRALDWLIAQHRIGALVSWNGTVWFYDEAAALRARHPRLRVFAQLYNHRGGWIEHGGPRLMAAVDGHLAVNRAIADALVDRGAPAARVHLVHHGVALPPIDDGNSEARSARRRQQRRALDLPDDALVLGSFIRLHPQKRPLDLLRLAQRFAPGGRDAARVDRPVHWLLVGGGPLDDAVDRFLAEHALPNVRRLPLRADCLPLYDALDLCIMTSAYEGLPIFLLDGLARGVPAIATAVGEIPLLLAPDADDGSAGGALIARVGDLDAFADAVVRLADGDIRAAAARAGRRQVARHFSLERYVARYRRVLLGASDDARAATLAP